MVTHSGQYVWVVLYHNALVNRLMNIYKNEWSYAWAGGDHVTELKKQVQVSIPFVYHIIWHFEHFCILCMMSFDSIQTRTSVEQGICDRLPLRASKRLK